MTRTLIAMLLLTAPALIAPALAAEPVIQLKPGPGVEVVQQNCSGCHSVDYILMNSPFLGADAWKAEVGKMRAAFGAGIDDADAATIATYLAASYGPAQ